jgi:hypothetical protein
MNLECGGKSERDAATLCRRTPKGEFSNEEN